jgi:glycosyltransferase involved in cell wall biosynthesis
MDKLSVIIPCYFNEANIPFTVVALLENEKLFETDITLEYVFVDDGSKDNTMNELIKFKNKIPDRIKIIKLSKNYGANNASLCGLKYATGNCCAILAADLQDPPSLLPQMIKHWKKGYKMVLANRIGRNDGLLNDIISNFFHLIISKLVLKNAPKGGADVFLLDRQLIDMVVAINEKNTYLPFEYLNLGFDYVSIPYTRQKRTIGESKWTLSKKIKSFVDSFVAFSFLPIRFISILGFILGFASLIYGAIIFYGKLNGKVPIQGWSSVMLVALIIGSFQMIALGIIGEYVWRTLDASRNRPNYIVDKEYL